MFEWKGRNHRCGEGKHNTHHLTQKKIKAKTTRQQGQQLHCAREVPPKMRLFVKYSIPLAKPKIITRKRIVTQVKFTCVEKSVMDVYREFLHKVVKKMDIPFTIFSLPTTTKRLTLLKSPHVDKSAREQFEIKTYKCILSIKGETTYNWLRFLLLNKPKPIKTKIVHCPISPNGELTFEKKSKRKEFQLSVTPQTLVRDVKELIKPQIQEDLSKYGRAADLSVMKLRIAEQYLDDDMTLEKYNIFTGAWVNTEFVSEATMTKDERST